MIMTYILPTYVKPNANSQAFTCPHCGVLAEQLWCLLTRVVSTNMRREDSNSMIGTCRNCDKLTIWLGDDYDEKSMVYPTTGNAKLPNEYMPEYIQKDYCEARDIVSRSPRAACVLLRLCIEKICDEQEAEGDSLAKKIEKMMEKGISLEINDAFTSVRIIGNDAAHPREINLADDIDTATMLFDIVNYIVEDIYAKQARIKEIGEHVSKNKSTGKK